MSDIIKIRNGNNSWIGVPSMAGQKGDKGDTGDRGPAGYGVPSGGETGEVLKKKSDADYDYEWGSPSSESGNISDVQVNGSTVVLNGVANVPIASSSDAGVVKVDDSYGFRIDVNGVLKIYAASDSNIKQGTNSYRPVASNHVQDAVFYGLAKAAGDTTQAASNNALGTYTEEAKTAIKNMLGVNASGGAVSPTITTTQTSNGYDLTITDINGTNTIALKNGLPGQAGHTPVKGTDYWTNADRESIIQDAINGVLAIYPAAEDNSY